MKINSAAVSILILLQLVGVQLCNAQICTGSLGDAVVNVTFGAGTNPGPALPAGTTTYNFITTDCPSDGSYTIINRSQSCFSSSWQNLTEDHTPNDANGYMMLVNASITPGDFFLDTVAGLCANTTYEFSAWVTNVLLPTACSPNPIHPSLKFNIETTTGTILGTYNTGDIFETSNPVWKQYGLFFTVPSGSNTVVIRLTNNAPGGCGNDLALDDITFKPCGPTIVAGSLVDNKPDIDICTTNTQPVVLTATIGSGFTTPVVQWQESLDNGNTWIDIIGANATNYTFTKTAIGKYFYRLTAAEGSSINISNCRVASNITTITIHALPTISITGLDSICEKKIIDLTANGANNYAWSGPNGYGFNGPSISLVAQNLAAGLYTVTGTDQFSCVNSVSKNIIIKQAPIVVVNSPINICKGDSVQLNVIGGILPQWLPTTNLSASNITNPYAKPIVTTTYFITVSGVNGCTTTDSIIINVFQKPIISAGPDKTIIKGQSVVLEGIINDNTVTYNWQPVTGLNDPLMLQPICSATKNTTYYFTANSPIGCGSSIDTVNVKVFDDLFIPNAFSPNNNGNNNVWNIEALAAYPDARLSVYNRFGQNIYVGIGNNKPWDGYFNGQPVDAGVYVYFIDFKNKRPLIKGTVTVIR